MKKVLVLLIVASALFTSCGMKEIKGNVSNDSTLVEPTVVTADSVVVDSLTIDSIK